MSEAETVPETLEDEAGEQEVAEGADVATGIEFRASLRQGCQTASKTQ